MVAPMVGISHVAFRELIRSYLPPTVKPYLFTEMLNTRRLPSQRLDSVEMLKTAENESSLVPQLLGNEESFIADSIRKLMPLNPSAFDINMGCPKTKNLAHNWGVTLLGDADYAAQVVRVTKRHSPVPVSVKLRASGGRVIDSQFLEKFTEKLEAAGADWLTIHCRAALQGHRGDADWEVLKEIQKKRTIPIVGNGNIQTADQALEMKVSTGVEGVMIARAATARPWILGQIGKKLGLINLPKAIPNTLEEEGAEYFRACLHFIELLEKYYGDTTASMKRLEFYVRIGSPWMQFGHHFWSGLRRLTTLQEARDYLNRYLIAYPQPMGNSVLL